MVSRQSGGGGARPAGGGAVTPGVSRGAALGRALRRRCPLCGARIFHTWFRIAPQCPGCGLLTDRGEHDYFLGAVLLNLVASESIPVLVVGIIAASTWPSVAWDALFWGGLAMAVIAALLGYPFAKTLWLFADMQVRPPIRVRDVDRPDVQPVRMS